MYIEKKRGLRVEFWGILIFRSWGNKEKLVNEIEIVFDGGREEWWYFCYLRKGFKKMVWLIVLNVNVVENKESEVNIGFSKGKLFFIGYWLNRMLKIKV